jgi:O-succinylbenzoic acid--CoA ligase
MKRCSNENIPAATTYGLTEAASQVATAFPATRHGNLEASANRSFTSVRIVDDDDSDKPTGEYGEIAVKGPAVMREYYDDPEATAEALRGGELHTGDIGYVDDDGDLWVTQRRSDLIVSGGENVYPAEVEELLKQHPAVKDVCVVGIDDREWGQRVAAAIVLKSDVTATAQGILAYSRGYLAGYKQPRIIKFVDYLPQTASGKIQRPAVKALFETEGG